MRAEFYYRDTFKRPELIAWARDWSYPDGCDWRWSVMLCYFRCNEWLFGDREAAD